MHLRWLAPAEAERLADNGQARRVSKRKDPRPIYRLTAVAEPSDSHNSIPVLKHGDMELLVNLKRGFIEGLSPDKVRVMASGRLQSLQRLAGWGLLPRNQALEDAGEV